METKNLSFDDRVLRVEKIDYLTGPNSYANYDILKQADLYGTDLGISFAFNDKTVFLFGDSFNEAKMQGRWNSNFIAYADKIDLKKGIKLTKVIVNEDMTIKPFFEGLHSDNDAYLTDELAEVTKIPTGAITLNGKAYLFYMSISHWFHGEQDWLIRYNQCLESADLVNWELVDSLRWSRDMAPYFGQIYPFKDPNSDYIYLYGIHGGRHHGLCVARVLKQNFLDFVSYEYLISKDIWLKGYKGLEMLAKSPYFVAGPKISEPCISYNAYLKKYALTYNMDGALMVLSDTPYGPFTEKIMLLPSEYLATYGCFTSQNLMINAGKSFYITLSQWEEYNIYLYKITLK